MPILVIMKRNNVSKGVVLKVLLVQVKKVAVGTKDVIDVFNGLAFQGNELLNVTLRVSTFGKRKPNISKMKLDGNESVHFQNSEMNRN